MFKTILSMQKEKKFIVRGLIVFTLFMVLYTMLDFLNIGYSEMIADYGFYLVVINVFVNLRVPELSTETETQLNDDGHK